LVFLVQLPVLPAFTSTDCGTGNDSGAMASYPRRELLGLSKADRMAIARQVIDSLG
jgi:hypothetical protein